ncbi:MAG: hypothetical protein UY83_C0016G0003 [Candidatus Adlerbacteria bacterium GW2011_GWA1_54_10]|uniref:Uncharacterized protein n=1 Tax=Candidatus Adlerbacteria bacterium GW2011_GWA1_54_10 TaxID=1618605 RepID=A0A0G1XW29_9BACT|nr:MAG: hypothetical protein UY83_C0016G0003 [Candidatus Adlerbacteria bacterium GW2011_GWA1_54_10]
MFLPEVTFEVTPAELEAELFYSFSRPQRHRWHDFLYRTYPELYEGPHLVWRLSEVMDPAVLQCHPKLAELIRPIKWGYNSFKDITIDGVEMVQYFAQVYKNCISAGYPFEQTMQKLWEEAQKHKDALERF